MLWLATDAPHFGLPDLRGRAPISLGSGASCHPIPTQGAKVGTHKFYTDGPNTIASPKP